MSEIEATFRPWRKRLGLTQAQVARRLGLSKRQIEYFDSGEKPLPPWARLAMLALEDHPELIQEP